MEERRIIMLLVYVLVFTSCQCYLHPLETCNLVPSDFIHFILEFSLFFFAILSSVLYLIVMLCCAVLSISVVSDSWDP